MQPPSPSVLSASGFTFATRQVAQLLGIGEATVKRLADAGKLEALREGRARRFPADRLARFLRADVPAEDDRWGVPPVAESFGAAFASAVRAQNLNLALASLIGALAEGWALARALEEMVEPALPFATGDWFLELLARVPPLGAEVGRPHSALVWSSAGRTVQAGSVSCLLRGQGFEVLTPADWLGQADVVALAARAAVRYAILVVDRPASFSAKAVELAAQLALECRAGTVVLYCPALASLPPSPRGVRRACSIGEVASLLAQAAPR